MKRMLCGLSVFLTVSVVANSAFAYCRAPGRAPEAPRSFDKPKTLSCLENVRYGEEADCDDIELDRYRREADQYLDKLQEFVDESERYAQKASAFAQCEAAEVRETIR